MKETIQRDEGAGKAVRKAVRLLYFLSARGRALGVREIAERTGMTKSSVQRVLAVLEDEGMVMADPVTRKYEIGYGVVELASRLLRGSTLASVSPPYLSSLRDRAGETAFLSARVGHHFVVLLQFESAEELRCTSEVGKSLPLYVGSSGKSILAGLRAEEIEEVFRDWPAAARPDAGAQRVMLLEELAEIRRQGHAVTFGEVDTGGVAIAAPMKDHHGTPFAAVCVYGPTARLTAARIEVLAPLVKETAAAIAAAVATGRSGGLTSRAAGGWPEKRAAMEAETT
jgi:DNA-binding IclR family transcriptional regulator